MTEGKRQKQIAKLLQQELSKIFLREGFNILDGGMISISSVKITPDLFQARVYLSMFQIPDQVAMLQKIQERSFEIKKQLVSQVKTQLRSMPELTFYLDDTLDHAFKMEELFKKIKEEGQPGGSD
ncbi:MAG: 30S ribosome-binding factor RbfA [Chitinophagaceae bacterium]